MKYEKLNFAKSKLLRFYNLNPQPGDEFETCNFAQPVEHTKIPDKYTGLTFRSCNMRNIDPPKDAVLIDSPNSHWSRCSHVHPNWDIPQCSENCKHVIDTDEIWLDGALIEKIYHYADLRLS